MELGRKYAMKYAWFLSQEDLAFAFHSWAHAVHGGNAESRALKKLQEEYGFQN